jgi:methionyl-tRNA formyltransferase
MPRIVFMGTPAFAVPSLQALIATGQVVGVVTQPDKPAGRGQQLAAPPVKVAAEAAGLPVYQPKSLRKEETAEPLRQWQPDLIVVAAFGQILRPHVLELPRLGCVNIHASLLPRWRGASPIQHAILAGDEATGITLMQMEAGLDTGPMLAVAEEPIWETDTAATLHDKLAQLGGQLLADQLANLLAGRLTPIAQDDTHATYAPLIGKEDGRLDWGETAVSLGRRVRAMTPWPGAFTMWQGQPLKVLAAHAVAEVDLPRGQVGVLADGSAVVGTAEGGLALHMVQLPGKRPLPSAEFMRGRAGFVGATLG